MAGSIRVGIGGWVFEPWRGTFYPEGLTHKRELEHASRQMTSIEINGTYYGAQKPESFARWHDETPDGFVFAVKGPRFATMRKRLAESGPSIERFFGSGVLELKAKLGPINWQLLPTRRFDPADLDAFLSLLPKRLEGREIRHAVELRHDSFNVKQCMDLLRAHGVAAVIADSDDHPRIANVTAPFVYARLQDASEACDHGYPDEVLDVWATRARAWAKGLQPADLPGVGGPPDKTASPRDVFLYMINGFKPKAPAAAMAMLRRFGPKKPG